MFTLYDTGGILNTDVMRDIAGEPTDPTPYYGREIKSASFGESLDGDGGEIRISFADGVSIRIWDDGQSCCENRYIVLDDDINSIVGHKLTGIVIKNVHVDDSWYHEIAFMVITTSANSITFATHNEHNGWYSGFSLSIEEIKA